MAKYDSERSEREGSAKWMVRKNEQGAVHWEYKDAQPLNRKPLSPSDQSRGQTAPAQGHELGRRAEPEGHAHARGKEVLAAQTVPEEQD